MSVRTEAGRKRDQAKHNIKLAIKHLQDMAQEDWGWDDYSEEYQDKVLEATTELIKIKRKL